MSDAIKVLKLMSRGVALIEDELYDSIGALFESAVRVEFDLNPDTRVLGQRSLTANTESEDPLERILAAFIEAYSVSLRLQRSGQDNVPINRGNLILHINTFNHRIPTFIDWFERSMNDATKTEDTKRSVKEAYENCKNAMANLNEYILKINENDPSVSIIWAPPDNGRTLPTLNPLP